MIGIVSLHDGVTTIASSRRRVLSISTTIQEGLSTLTKSSAGTQRTVQNKWVVNEEIIAHELLGFEDSLWVKMKVRFGSGADTSLGVLQQRMHERALSDYGLNFAHGEITSYSSSDGAVLYFSNETFSDQSVEMLGLLCAMSGLNMSDANDVGTCTSSELFFADVLACSEENCAVSAGYETLPVVFLDQHETVQSTNDSLSSNVQQEPEISIALYVSLGFTSELDSMKLRLALGKLFGVPVSFVKESSMVKAVEYRAESLLFIKAEYPEEGLQIFEVFALSNETEKVKNIVRDFTIKNFRSKFSEAYGSDISSEIQFVLIDDGTSTRTRFWYSSNNVDNWGLGVGIIFMIIFGVIFVCGTCIILIRGQARIFHY